MLFYNVLFIIDFLYFFMVIMKNILLFSAALLLVGHCDAQYNLKENNVWAFGYHAGLDFSSGTAVPILTAISGNGGPYPIFSAASVCDTAGHLLFYTSGDTIWNKNNQAMPGGYNLMPVLSGTSCSFGGSSGEGVVIPPNVTSADAAQGAVIVPVLSNPDQYYVFSLQYPCVADAAASRLYYSVVDMTLNNGLGDVVTAQKGILLDSSLSEKMISIAGDNCDMWLLVHGNQDNIFYAFDITKAGINPVPVVSETGNISGFMPYTYGYIAASPNRRRIALASSGADLGVPNNGTGAELYDFDPATGIVSDAITLNTNSAEGICFSPDGTKLYLDGSVDILTASGYTDTNYISQYDLNQTTLTGIIASRVDLIRVTGPSVGDEIKALSLGPDGKIYMPSYLHGETVGDSLDVINFPNLASTACQLVHNAIQLAYSSTDSSYMDIGLPNMYSKPLRDTIYTTTDTSMTLANGLTLQIPSGYFSYVWNDGSTDSSKAITDTGTYWVTYGDYCTYRSDTFVVRPATGVAHINGSDIATLNVFPSPAQTTITITIKGIYRVNGTILVTDELGRTVLEQPCSNSKQTINVNNMAAGVYSVEYIDKEQPVRLLQRLVITR